MTNNIDKELLRIYKDILENGEPRNDRTGVGTLATFFQTISFYEYFFWVHFNVFACHASLSHANQINGP